MIDQKYQVARLEGIGVEVGHILHSKVMSGLDAVRVLAITLVLVDHFGLITSFRGVRLGLGSFGVMIFFVLSGFLITTLLLREFRQTGAISLRNFYRRRAYRIFPTFYFCWIFTAVVDCLARQFDWKGAIASFFYAMDYWRAFVPQSYLSHMAISWSLAVEEKFYLLWPPLLLFLLSKERRRLISAIVFMILGQWVYRGILFLVLHVRGEYIYNTFDMRADTLLVGCLLAILLEHDDTRLLCCGLLRWQWLSAIPCLALVFEAISPPSNQVVSLLVWSITPVIIAVMLLQAIYWGWKSWTICSSVVVRITALLSYALYLYQPLALKIAYRLHFRHVGHVSAILTLLMAATSYQVIEKPFMRMRDRHESRISSPVGIQAPTVS